VLKVLVVDNYDSFVYNLVQYVGELGGKPLVFRSSQLTLKRVARIKPDRVIISPGPGSPDSRYFGVCSEIIRRFEGSIPILGVCLGCQGIIHVFGGRIVRAKRLMHGKTSLIKHDGKRVFQGVKNPFEAARYHSLAGDRGSMPECLRITAETVDDGEVMGVRHVNYPIEGVQFHPESILTPYGKLIIKNFLEGG